MLIKYLKQEHLELLMEQDTLRVGSSRQYRSAELGAMVGDPREGEMVISGEAQQVSPANRHLYPGLNRLLSPDSNVGTISVSNLRIITGDFLMCSCALGYELDAHLKWNFYQQYDSSYQIVQPEKFFNAISRELHEQCGVKTLRHGCVAYYDDVGFDIRDERTLLPPEFSKAAKSYANQKEYRVVWPDYDRDKVHPS